MGEPVEVIKGKFTGLPIPAHAEIVLEGEVSARRKAAGGPLRRMERILRGRKKGRAGPEGQAGDVPFTIPF